MLGQVPDGDEAEESLRETEGVAVNAGRGSGLTYPGDIRVTLNRAARSHHT